MRIERLAEVDGPFDSYHVTSASEERYVVEIRSLDAPINSCECRDHEINRLGTCKHVEAVRRRLRRRGVERSSEAAAGSPRAEIFLDPREHRVRALWPRRRGRRLLVERRLARFFHSDGTLKAQYYDTFGALNRAIDGLHAASRHKVRVSRCLHRWLERDRRIREHQSARQEFEDLVSRDRSLLELVDAPLYAYQQEGVLHLAFTERALLADEMGLGKTVQAIAACILLRRLRGIERVLVVAPASLKAEWEEQISRFCNLDARAVYGSRVARLEQYRRPAFFTLVNYEQVRSDMKDLQRLVAADVVILDEAQRIKNWRTRTAASIKRLQSRYAFVLTGTPLENRIDEIYSIAEFLDPHLFGPLFRFNRDFYSLDERGRPVGYKNLDELHRRLRPIMLRRRKLEVEGELPPRTVNTYYVEMTAEQRVRYDEYAGHVARLLARAKRRPLTPEEFERLQQWLACMRMLCDTTYILDSSRRDCPKLDELAKLLVELLETPGRKVIVFSEWERMLELVREHADDASIGYAWHTGSVPQKRRRGEINRFKDDPSCRIFLSTDSGSVGLNLQVADVVINLDQPWNPARLEQRIARAWRKHQRRPVQVVNLVTVNSIEQRMLTILENKRLLADSVVDASTDISAMEIPSGRAALVERLEKLTMAPSSPATPAPTERSVSDEVRDVLSQSLGTGTSNIQTIGKTDAPKGAIAVVDRADHSKQNLAHAALRELPGARDTLVEILDANTLAAISRLVALGVLSPAPEIEALISANPVEESSPRTSPQQLAEARERARAASRSRAVATTLASGGFLPEAVKPTRDAVEVVLDALALAAGIDDHKKLSPAVLGERIAAELGLSDSLAGWVDAIRQSDAPESDKQVESVLAAAHHLFDAADTLLA